MENTHTLTHPSTGAQAIINFQGATLTSFLPSPTSPDLIFVSKNNTWADEDAIRGGIPVCFPQFGTELWGEMKQHGFFRSNLWRLRSGNQDDHKKSENCPKLCDSVSCTFVLTHKDIVRDCAGTMWDGTRFTAAYTVTISTNVETKKIVLSTNLDVKNDNEICVTFSNLLHTYYSIGDYRNIRVKGLEGYRCTDTMKNPTRDEDKTFLWETSDVVVDGEIDRIYHPTDETGGCIDVVLKRTEEEKDNVRVFASGSVEGVRKDLR